MHKIYKLNPEISRYEGLNRDGCYFCKNKHNCNQCKKNKEVKALGKRKNNKKILDKILKECYN